jgi:maleate isomerase
MDGAVTTRVGLIIPSSNRMVEQEMVRYFPEGVQAHVMRLRMTGPHRVPLAQLTPRIEEAARTLMDAKCDVVAFHCTAGSTEAGLAGEEQALAAVARGGARATTTATAIRNAFAALGARRIVLVTPYDARTTEEEAVFFRSAGYDVLAAIGSNIATFGIIAELEERLDRPVVTSNQAVLWDALCRLGWSDRRRCPGRLFAAETRMVEPA